MSRREREAKAEVKARLAEKWRREEMAEGLLAEHRGDRAKAHASAVRKWRAAEALAADLQAMVHQHLAPPPPPARWGLLLLLLGGLLVLAGVLWRLL